MTDEIKLPTLALAFYRDLYTRHRLDFRTLARDDPEFAAFCTRPGQIDFHNPGAVRQLTRSLLRRDFRLSIDLPPDRLCPPVPNRLSYVVWVTELVGTTLGSETSRQVIGLDIGTGASCIYPLLACTVTPAWRFVATDIDAESLQSARFNVERNRLTERIRIASRTSDDSLVALDKDDSQSFTFTMCNPPFYASADEMTASAAAKQQPPHSACTGAPVEMVYSPSNGDGTGGEVAFVGRILAESLVLRNRVCWYTAMLGKLASLATLVAQLRAHGIDNYAVAALLVPGGKTRRWVLGWSFGAVRPTVSVARGGPDAAGLESYRHLLPAVTEVDVYRIANAENSGGMGVGPAVDIILRGLELLLWNWDSNMLQGVGRTRENVWGRAWRRKKQNEARSETVQGHKTEAPKDSELFVFELTVRIGVSETVLHCRWLEGHNEAIYQSLCGFIKSKLKERFAMRVEEKATKALNET
ncbi:MAG: hypothetical protein SEPTF4163_005056 [Sporothrix epigloea]